MPPLLRQPLCVAAAAAVAVAATVLPISALAAFYLTAVAFAALAGVAFAAYLRLVEGPTASAAAELGCYNLAALLLGCAAALRFPDILTGTAPPAASTLAAAAAVSAGAGALLRGLALVLARGLRAWPRLPLRSLLSR